MSKLAWITFHKNVRAYPSRWIDDYVNSVYNQTINGQGAVENNLFQLFEINYGNGNERLFPESKFYKKLFPNHAHAHNFILDEVFKEGYSYAFNSNCDDAYLEDRIERQLPYCKQGYDIISANHSIIDGDNNILNHDIQFSKMAINLEMSKGHNIISHPCVVYSKNFWTKCPKLNPDLIPKDDMELWKWGLFNGFKFVIAPYSLLYYRIHPDSVAAPRRK